MFPAWEVAERLVALEVAEAAAARAEEAAAEIAFEAGLWGQAEPFGAELELPGCPGSKFVVVVVVAAAAVAGAS